ncbi:hypothetical protein HY991_06195 [Candidatus Micrarchaeota archaeon]|nr:hypothetical protein [Candidatus Micrarchaeota archaeon]
MRKGFVGPIGDDIPSIFPIIAGVMLFLGTVVYATNAIESKNRELDIRRTTLGLAYIATEKGFINPTDFDSRCQNISRPYADRQHIKFAIVVKKFCKAINVNTNVFSAEADASTDGRGFDCTNDQTKLSTMASDPSKVPKDIIILNYPIAVQDPCGDGSITNGLGMLNVVVWRPEK